MKRIMAAMCFVAVAAAPLGYAQDKAGTSGKKAPVAAEKSAKKEPTDKQKAQQARMKDCATRAGERKGDERKAFMSSCMKGKTTGAAAVPGEKKTAK